MKFVNPHTGADVADHDVGTHLHRRVRFEDNKLRDMCFAAQPGADWEAINGVRTIAYSDAMVWAAAAAFGGPNLRGVALWDLRPSPAKMEATLALAAGAMPTIIKAATKGKWLQALRAAADTVDAANRSAGLVWSRGDLIALPTPASIPMTNSEGITVGRTVAAVAAQGGNPAVPEQFVQADDSSGWAHGPEWVQLITIGDLWERGTSNLLKVGELWYSIGGDIDADYQTKNGPLGCLASRAADVLGISASEATKYPADAAAVFAAAAASRKVSVAFAIYRPEGAQRRLAKLAEFECEKSAHRKAAEHTLVYERVSESVAWWPSLHAAVKGEAASDVVPELVVGLALAAGGDGQLSLYALDRLEAAVDNFSHYLELEDVRELPAPARCTRLESKLRASAKPTSAGGGAQFTTSHPALGQDQPLSHKDSGRRVGGVPRDLIVKACAEDRRWAIGAQTAYALYKANDFTGALQVLFTGKAARHPNLGPSTLARMLLFGKIKVSDLDDSAYAWIDDVIPRIPDYLGERVLHGFIEDGELGAEDKCILRLTEFWEQLKLKGSEWPSKLDLEGALLGPLLSVVDGTPYAPVPLKERYRDMWRLTLLDRPVGAAFAALGGDKSGEGTVRHVIASSSQTVMLFGKDGGDVAARLSDAQARLITGALGELGEAFDLTLGANPMFVINMAPIRAANQSPSRIKWAQARQGFREQAQKLRTGHAAGGGSNDHVKQLPSLASLVGKASGAKPPPQKEEAAAKKAAEAKERAEKQEAGTKAQAERLRAATEKGAIVKDERILFDSTEYARPKFEAVAPGVCELFLISARRSTHKPLCDGTKCGRSHAASEISNPFKLFECRADPPYTFGAAAARSGKGGDKRPGGGGGGGKGKGARK